MPSLLKCGNCDTPLLSTVDVDDPVAATSALVMSHLALRGDGYATNVYMRGRGCPICGWQGANVVGCEPVPPRRPVHCTRGWDGVQPGLHARIHLGQDHRLGFLKGKSGHYALVQSALRHFVLGPGSMTLGDAIGALALMDSRHPNPAMAFLCKAVHEVTGSVVDPSAHELSTWDIRGGVCVVIVPPEPQAAGEPYLVGVVVQATAAELFSADLATLQTTPQLFVLERTRVPSSRAFPAMLCQWKSATRTEYYDNERRNYGWGPNPVVADFLDSLERIMVSGLWK